MLPGMSQGLIAQEWVSRPETVASDWPASDLDARRLPLAVALRVVRADNVVGLVTRVVPDGLEIDYGTVRVPFGAIRAYALLHEPLDDSDAVRAGVSSPRERTGCREPGCAV